MTKQLKEIEIPFGAKDSELCGWEYTIPDGMEATIVDNRIIVRKEESKDEKIRKEMIAYMKHPHSEELFPKAWIDWLEKQGEHANFLNKIQIGDKVTRNKDGMLVNLSQLNRVAKEDEKQDEQKSAWSEEDDAMFNFIALILRNHQSDEDFTTFKTTFKDCIDWFKNLKDRVQPQNWKPSDEQMKALKEAVDEHFDIDGGALWHLYQDLKKLREE